MDYAPLPADLTSSSRSPAIPSWFSRLAHQLVTAAEHAFKIPKSGATKKAWVENALKAALHAAASLDPIPDWIENPIADVIVSVVVEALWGALFGHVDETTPETKT